MIADTYREKTAGIMKEVGKPDAAMIEAHYAAVKFALALCPELADLIEAVEVVSEETSLVLLGGGEVWHSVEEMRSKLGVLREKMEELG